MQGVEPVDIIQSPVGGDVWGRCDNRNSRGYCAQLSILAGIMFQITGKSETSSMSPTDENVYHENALIRRGKRSKLT